jgi:hypothetical protein
MPCTLHSYHEVGGPTMGLRLVETSQTGYVFSLYGDGTDVDTSSVDKALPEPAGLYGLTILAFLLHTPTRVRQRCVRCETAWPCEHLRLAYRLREGF